MKIRTLMLIGILLASFVFPLGIVDKVYASCAAEVDYDLMLEESELAFIGTVDRLENYDGPQRVTFIIHDVIKGEINTPKYILENSGVIFLENDSVRNSSYSVDYQISKTYKVFVVNGDTDSCSTKEIFQTDYLWQPGPESGKYTSENPVWVNPCDEGYGSSDGVCITLEEMQLLAPPHLEPNQYPKDAPHSEPIPEPQYFENIDKEKPCGDGTTYQNGICVAIHQENSNQTENQNDKWPAAYQNDTWINPYQDISNDFELKIRCEPGTVLENGECISICGDDAELVDGICQLVITESITEFIISEDHSGMGGFILIGIPAIITIIIISVIGYKKS